MEQQISEDIRAKGLYSRNSSSIGWRSWKLLNYKVANIFLHFARTRSRLSATCCTSLKIQKGKREPPAITIQASEDESMLYTLNLTPFKKALPQNLKPKHTYSTRRIHMHSYTALWAHFNYPGLVHFPMRKYMFSLCNVAELRSAPDHPTASCHFQANTAKYN